MGFTRTPSSARERIEEVPSADDGNWIKAKETCTVQEHQMLQCTYLPVSEGMGSDPRDSRKIRDAKPSLLGIVKPLNGEMSKYRAHDLPLYFPASTQPSAIGEATVVIRTSSTCLRDHRNSTARARPVTRASVPFLA